MRTELGLLSSKERLPGITRPRRSRRRGLWAVLTGALVGASLISPSTAQATSYEIGDRGPGGGIVFITPTTTGNATGLYFEVLLSGIDLPACLNRADFLNNVTDVAIGAGAGNTTAIRDECARIGGNDATNSAFAWIKSQTVDGFSDWFIPSEGEAARIWAERATPSVGMVIAGLNGTNAWMSNVENDPNNANNPAISVFGKATGPNLTSTSLNGFIANFFVVRSFSASDANPPPGTPNLVDFSFYLPNGQECSAISPQRVQVGSVVELPGEDALCRTSEGSLVAGWTIPVPPGFTGAGSSSLPFNPGQRVRVIESQRFTAVLFDPVLTVEYDSNIAADDTCTPANMAFASEDGRVGYSWVPRSDSSVARTWSAATCSPAGYELIGWNTRGDGSGQSIGLGEPLPDSWGVAAINDRRLFAVWRAAGA
jgi:hypothetical protein